MNLLKRVKEALSSDFVEYLIPYMQGMEYTCITRTPVPFFLMRLVTRITGRVAGPRLVCNMMFPWTCYHGYDIGQAGTIKRFEVCYEQNSVS